MSSTIRHGTPRSDRTAAAGNIRINADRIFNLRNVPEEGVGAAEVYDRLAREKNSRKSLIPSRWTVAK